MPLFLFGRLWNRTPWFFAVLALLAAWVVFGRGALESQGAGANDVDRYVSREIERVKRLDPAAGAELDRMARERDAAALAAALRIHDAQTDGNGPRAVVRALSRSGGDLPWYDLSHAGLRPDRFADAGERERFMLSHGLVYRALLETDGSGAMASEYVKALDTAEAAGGDAWSGVREDPAAVSFYPYLRKDDAAWSYYRREREWLTPSLASLSRVDPDGQEVDPPVWELVDAGRRYHPLPRAISRDLALPGGSEGEEDPGGTLLVLRLFAEYGDLFMACRDLSVPVSGAVEVVFANPDRFEFPEDPLLRAEAVRRAAGRLAETQKNRPRVWDAAKREPLTLWLDEKAPAQVERLLERYPDGDLPSLLYASYAGQAAAAAQAILTFGDLGILVLTKYQDHPEFKKHLADPRVGVRIVPFILRYPDDGFALLAGGQYAWVDKYFNPDGSEKAKGWLQDIPLVGGPANVARNWVKGEPNTWGELGWAAFDAVDAALLVASFGGSKLATEGGKQVVKRTARRTGAETTEALAKRAGRSAALGSAGAAAVGRAGAAGVARRTGASLLRRVAAMSLASLRWTGRVVVAPTGRAVWRAIESSRVAWAATPGWVRRSVYGFMGFLGLGYSIAERNAGAAVRGAMADAGRTAGEMMKAVARGTAEAAANAVNGVVARPDWMPAEAWTWGGWGAGIALGLVVLWWLRPTRRDLGRFARGI